MTRIVRTALHGLALALLALSAQPARAQGPTIDSGSPSVPGGGESSLGPSPGEVEGPESSSPGQDVGVLGGRPGPSVPRVSPSLTRPGGTFLPERRGIALPEALPVADVPLYGPLAIPDAREEEPPNGLTLDAAIERLVQMNTTLRAQALEIPQARADVLTAGLRANPVFYADAQLVPYGGFPKDRPGGQTQYDVNISYPVDITRKRQARTAVARQAERVVEAQFQDAVRLQIENLYTAYVDVLAARETVRFARASHAGLEKLLGLAQTQKEKDFSTGAEVNRVKILRDASEIGVKESESALRQARRTLASLLKVPHTQAEAIELRGTIRDVSPPPPPEDALVSLALASRPDLVAYRLGVNRAVAEVQLARANRLSDVYVLYQPFTSQANPAPQADAISWALGATVPLPIYNRNQGNIRRARINVNQTQIELQALEGQVATEVRKAREQYAVSRSSVERIERDLLPASRQVLNTASHLYESGQENLAFYLNAQRDYNEIVRQYRDTLVRHRRDMLNLNTAVGQRILP